jgi:transposase InsO family protein
LAHAIPSITFIAQVYWGETPGFAYDLGAESGRLTATGASTRQRALLDNIFVERLWRSLKYEELYHHAYDSLTEARVGIGRYFRFYNDARPHTALGYQTPAAFYDSTPRSTAQ